MKTDFCFLCNSLKPGGGNRVIYEICQQIHDASTYTYEILSIDHTDFDKKFSKASNLNSRQIGFKGKSKLIYIVNLVIYFIYILIFAYKYKFIIVSSPLLSPLFGIIPIRNKYSYIQADDYVIFDGRMNKIAIKIYKFVTRYISYACYGNNYLFNSYFTYQKFKDVSPLKNKNLELKLVTPGVDLSIFNPKKIEESNQENNLYPKVVKIIVATVLRKQAWKGCIDFIEVAKNISQEGNGNIEFIGITNEDVSILDIPNFLTVYRPSSDIELADLIKKSNIFVSTSRWEGFGLPAIEAMACGCAVISSDNGGCNEYAVNCHNCLIYEPGDTNHLQSLIIKLSENEFLRNSLINNGITTTHNFTWEMTFKSLLKSLEM
jgi:glycosyltransferase involved in cell wall biosynthesis